MKSRTPRRGARRSVFPSFVQSPRGPSAARSQVQAKAKVTFHNCPKDTPFPAAPSSAFFAKPLFAPPTTPPPKPPNPRLRPGKRCPRPPMRPSPGCHRRASIRPARLVAADELEGARFVDWDTHKRMEEMGRWHKQGWTPRLPATRAATTCAKICRPQQIVQAFSGICATSRLVNKRVAKLFNPP